MLATAVIVFREVLEAALRHRHRRRRHARRTYRPQPLARRGDRSGSHRRRPGRARHRPHRHDGERHRPGIVNAGRVGNCHHHARVAQPVDVVAGDELAANARSVGNGYPGRPGGMLGAADRRRARSAAGRRIRNGALPVRDRRIRGRRVVADAHGRPRRHHRGHCGRVHALCRTAADSAALVFRGDRRIGAVPWREHGVAGRALPHPGRRSAEPRVRPFWDTSGLLPQASIAGTLLHSLVGYQARPPGMQIVFYLHRPGRRRCRHGSGSTRAGSVPRGPQPLEAPCVLHGIRGRGSSGGSAHGRSRRLRLRSGRRIRRARNRLQVRRLG